MSLLSANIPNMVGGVSQQPAAIRRENQTDSQTNAYGTMVEGLGPRRPSFHVAKLIASAMGPTGFWHLINRDPNEQYIAVINGVGPKPIRVFDLKTGAEKTVNFPDGYAYLLNANPKNSFRASTVADFTFIVNKTVTAAMDPALSPKAAPEALVYVKQGNYGKTYSITLNGLTYSYTTPDGSSPSHANNIDTSFIAAALVSAIGTPAGFVVNRYNNAIHIRCPSADFTLGVADGFSGLAMLALKGSTQRFTDLPTNAPDGFVIGITGDKGLKGDTFYLRFTKLNASDSIGTWKETLQPGIPYKFDPATMPWQLVRQSDGTFNFQKGAWTERECGDDLTNPKPSFIGRTISSVYFSRNRLGFTAGENSVNSRSGEFFSFWRRTVTTLLEDDPVDVAATSVRVSNFKHAVPFNKALVLFAEQGQHELGSNGALTAKTAAIVPTSEYEAAELPPPAATGTSVFFAVEQDNYCQMREYYADGQANNKNSAYNTTEHCPRYIPAGVTHIAASRSEDVVCVLTDGDPNAIYVYRYLGTPDDRIQSAWTRWDLGAPVRYAEFIKADLHVVTERDSAMWLEKIPIAAGKVDEGMKYLTLMDRRVTEADLIAPSYNSTANTTTFTLPYTATGARAAVRYSASYGGALLPGQTPTVLDTTDNTITLKGDHRTTPLYFGFLYETRIDLSAIYPRERRSASKDTKTTVIEGRLQLRYITLLLGNTSNLSVEVAPTGRSTRTKVFNGRIIGNAQSIIGAVPLYSGKFRVPVLSRANTTKISIVHKSHLPMNVLAMEWEGLFTLRSGRSP
jgi:hypothetical protein